MAITKKRSCTSKIRYTSKNRAIDVAVKLSHYIYRCRFCNGWHTCSK